MKRMKILIPLISGLIFCACEKYLTEDPSTELPVETVFQSEQGLETAVVGCYSSFQGSNLWQGNFTEFLGYASGLIHWKANRSGTEQFIQGLDLVWYSNSSQVNDAYRSLYQIINRANTIIENLEASPVDPAYKAEINGEAHLIRAIAYFTAVRLWGDTPVVTRTPQTLDEAHLPRSPYREVYRQILDDLEVAERDMRDATRQKAVTGNSGRPNKWAAASFRAKVLVQIGSILGYPNDQPFLAAPDFTNCGIENAAEAWTQALTVAERVIEEGPYVLADHYADLFRWTTPEDFQLPERVFVIQNTLKAGKGYYVERTLPEYPVGSSHYNMNANNWGRARPSRFFFQKFAKTYAGELGVGRTDGLTDVYVNCKDPRFDISFFHTSFLQYSGNSTTIVTTNIYPSDGLVNNMANMNSAMNTTALPYFKKYLDPKYNADVGYADYYLMRFADLYLLAAEAAAELSTSVNDAYWNKALSHIGTLHARARRSVPAGSPEAAQPRWEEGRFATKEELIAAIVYERFYEMSGEGHEWFDLRRKGAQFMIDHFAREINAFNLQASEQSNTSNPNRGAWYAMYFNHVYAETKPEMLKRLLCGFPSDEIRTNRAIGLADQNPPQFIIK